MASRKQLPVVREMPLEVAVFSSQEALRAEVLGASRIELNATGSYAQGGLTPMVSELVKLKGKRQIPASIMIRPRGGDFEYNAQEVAAMVVAMCRFKASGAMDATRGDRFVFGAVQRRSDGRLAVDRAVCEALLAVARPFESVFHRAVDGLIAQGRGVDTLRLVGELGFAGVLTAGGAGSCVDNGDELDRLCHAAAGVVDVVVGGGLRAHNGEWLAAQLAVYESVAMHSAAVKRLDNGQWAMDDDEVQRLAILTGQVEPA
ncbi:hypothetical protein CDD82_7770 [Ophiocordyceps australis]|uniref:Copper homeostasis protein cutC homolog n=1 Tax=Ophiocordyceps australis TaxID=1399860 RepID=A0A2C5XEE7_9HYPO|nr:hypothetical protein CDD82_7770 [Ophiocordyceps australis]